MSDYLHNLVARMLSPEAGVRPQLRSAFEPPSLHDGFTSSADFESEGLSESNSSGPNTPPISPSLIASAPFEQVPIRDSPRAAQDNHVAREGRPREVVSPAKPTQISRDVSPVDPFKTEDILPSQPAPSPLPTEKYLSAESAASTRVTRAPPPPVPENERALPKPPAASRHNRVATPRHRRVAVTAETPRLSPAVIRSQTMEPHEPRSEPKAVPAIHSSALSVPGFPPNPSPTRRLETTRPISAFVPAEGIESGELRAQPKSAAAIRPVVSPAPPFSAHHKREPAVASAPSIQVTIGRVEVRAAPPPASSRARPRPNQAPIMSLEEYLRQRAAGGAR